MRRLIALAIVLTFALGFLYIGTMHRDRCLKAGGSSCTILPWSGAFSSGGRGYVLGAGNAFGPTLSPNSNP